MTEIARLLDGSTLSTTGDHSVFDVSAGLWSPISEFDSGDALLGLSGETLTVTGFGDASGVSSTAWNLSVGGVHNFFVAADHAAVPVLVHNASDFCALPVSLANFNTLSNITDPVEAAAYADVLTSFGRIADLNDLGAEAYEASLKVLADFAGTNPGVAAELVTTRPLWVKAASVNGDGPLADVLDAVVRTPALRAVAPDRMLSLVRRGDLDDVLAALPSVNRLSSPQPELVSHIFGRPDAAGILQAMDETPIDGAAPVLAGRLNEFDFGNPSWVDVYLDAWMDIRSRGAAVFGPDSTSVSALLASLPTNPALSGTWADVAATKRGLILEEFDFVRRGGRLPPGLNTYNHRFYLIADDFRDGVLTQYKTVDFVNFFQTSERISTWERGIQDSIDKLAGTRDPLTGGISRRVSDGVEIRAIDPEDILETKIEIVVPPRFASDSDIASQQEAALQRVLDYANQNVSQVVVRWAN